MFKKRPRRRHVEGIHHALPERQRAYVTFTAYVGVALFAVPSLDRAGEIFNYGSRGSTHIQRRPVYRQRLYG